MFVFTFQGAKWKLNESERFVL